MDARTEPAGALGNEEGDNHVICARIADERGADASEIDFLPFADVGEAVRASVDRVLGAPLLPDSFGARGFVHDVSSGKLSEGCLAPGA